MADMTREQAINYLYEWLQEAKAYCDGAKHVDEDSEKEMEVFDMTISDMKQVKELEAENERLKEMVESLNTKTIGREIAIRGLMTANKRLKEGIEKVKAEIKHTDFDMLDYYDNTEYIQEKVLTIINKYLGEVGDKG